jgi:dTDP-L-rhamnose 4-epimerase
VPADSNFGPGCRSLVTGGGGFIGRRLVRRLLDEGHDVTVLDALIEPVHGPDPRPPSLIDGCRFVRADIRDPDTLRPALRDQDLVFHLAAETGTGESMYRAQRYVDVNIGGTALLGDLISEGVARPARIVLASSRAVYGEGPYRCESCGVVYPGGRSADALARAEWELRCPTCGGPVVVIPVTSSTRRAPTSVYGMTKQGQEDVLRTVLPGLGVDLCVLRLQNVYGPGQSVRNPYTGILSIFSELLVSGQEVRVFEDGAESRDFIYVDDAVESFMRAGLGNKGGLVLDVGSGRPTSVIDIASALKRLIGDDASRVRVTGEYRVGDIRHAVASTDQLEAALGSWERTPLERGLERLTAWVRSMDRSGSRLDSALDEMRASGLLGQAVGAGR